MTDAKRETYASDRRAETIDYLRRALESAERGYWTQCRDRAQVAAKASKQWEHAADTWREWPNAAGNAP